MAKINGLPYGLLACLLLTGPRAVCAAPVNIAFDGIAPAATPAPGPRPAVRVYGGDVTAEYEDALARADAAFSGELVANLRRYKVLLVPGLFSNVHKDRLSVVGVFCSSTTKPRYEEHMALLKGLGVEVEKLEMETESSIHVNAAIISAAIKASARPVILIGSSKAGLDVLETLVADRALLPRVRGVLMLQAPFLGTPVADALMSNSAVNRLLSAVLRDLGGSRDALLNLTVADRTVYMRKNAAAIAEVTAAVPVISVATWMDPVKKGERDTGLKPLRNFMLKKGLKNDGLVPLDSAVLPGSDFIKIAGADHGATAQPTKLPFDRVKFTKAALMLLLAR